jgi:hypothetical protein
MPAPDPPQPAASPASTFAQAALANRDIRSYRDDPRYAGIWTMERVARHPTVRVVFEHAEVIGGPGESLAAACHKNFGRFLGIQPLRPDDPVHPCRILFVYKATSPYNRRVEQRRALKRLLGRQYQSLVTKASRSTKKDFLKFDLTPEAAKTIARRLKLDPGRFWRVAKGKEFLELPLAPRQLLLFQDEVSPKQAKDSEPPRTHSSQPSDLG